MKTVYRMFCDNHEPNVEMTATTSINGNTIELTWKCDVCQTIVILHIIDEDK